MFESRAPSAKFKTIGDTVQGEIVDVRRVQSSEYNRGGPGLPQYWQDKKVVTNSRNPQTGEDNDPKLQYEITVDTGTPDEMGETERRIFVSNKRQTEALKLAVKAAGGRDGLLIGGHLSAGYIGEEDTGAGQPAKVYVYTYRPPAAGEGRKPDLTPVLAGGGHRDSQVSTGPAVGAGVGYASGGIARPYQPTGISNEPGTNVRAIIAAQSGDFDDEPPF